jgi:branched-chain amino acid transport system substrate-binding protein
VRTRRAFLGAAAAFGSLPALPAAAQIYGQNAFSISTIGVAVPQTGEQAPQGTQLINGVKAAIDDTNRLRTQLERAFTFRTFDDASVLASGLVNVQFAANDQSVICMIGHLSGRITFGTLSAYANTQMPLIIPVSSLDSLTERGYGNIVRLATKDDIEGRLSAINVRTTAKPTKVVSVFLDGDYGYGVANGFDVQMRNDKVPTDTLRFSYQKPDFAAIATQVMAGKPDTVFLSGLATQLGPAVPALRAAGYSGPLFAPQGFFDRATAAIGAGVEGIIVSSSMPPLALSPAAYRTVNDFESRYGPMTPIAAFGYSAAQIAMEAARRGASQGRAGVLRVLQLPSYTTLVGPFQFNLNGDPNDPNVYFYTLRDGKWTYLHAAHPSSFLVK